MTRKLLLVLLGLALLGLAPVPGAYAAGPASVSGRVTDEGGHPLAGVKVSLDTFRPGTGWDTAVVVTTGADGSYRAVVPDDVPLPADAMMFFNAFGVTGPAGETWASEYNGDVYDLDDAPVFNLAPGQARTEENAQLAQNGSIAGIVHLPSAGPAATFDVDFVSSPGFKDEEGPFTAGQHFEIDRLPPGDYRLALTPRGSTTPYVRSYSGGGTVEQAAAVVTVRPGEATTIEETLVIGARLSGVVTMLPGDQAWRNEVTVLDAATGDPALRNGSTELAATPAANGTWSISGVPAGDFVVSFARFPYYGDDADLGILAEAQYWNGKPESAGFAAATPISVEPGDVVGGLDARMSRGGVISAKLVDGSGEPVDCWAMAYDPGGVVGTRYWDDLPASSPKARTERYGEGSATGAVAVGGLTAGAYVVRFYGCGDRTPRYYSATSPTGVTGDATTATPIDVGRGQSVSLGTLQAAGAPLGLVASDDAASTTMGRSVDIAVAANDRFPGGAPVRVTELTQPMHGTVECLGAGDPVCRYTSGPGYVGADSFTYRLTDGDARSNVATVAVQVRPDPSCPSARAETAAAERDVVRAQQKVKALTKKLRKLTGAHKVAAAKKVRKKLRNAKADLRQAKSQLAAARRRETSACG